MTSQELTMQARVRNAAFQARTLAESLSYAYDSAAGLLAYLNTTEERLGELSTHGQALRAMLLIVAQPAAATGLSNVAGTILAHTAPVKKEAKTP